MGKYHTRRTQGGNSSHNHWDNRYGKRGGNKWEVKDRAMRESEK
jgi:hypothetical protein